MSNWVYQPLLPATADIQSEPPPENTGQVKVWTGASWIAKPVKVWDGSSWVVKPMKFWNGGVWIETSY